MKRFRDLSLRYKIPLRVIALVLITACMVTASLLAREYDQLKRDLVAQAGSLGRVLARTLTGPLLHDDVWRAYEIINVPYRDEGAEPRTPTSAEIVMVLDPRGRIYVSTQPAVFRMLAQPSIDHPEYGAVEAAVAGPPDAAPQALEPEDSDRLFVLTPIVSDGVALGTLVMGYSKSVFLPRFYDVGARAGAVTLLVLLVLLPLAWYWGQRTGRPLIELAAHMDKAATALPSEQEVSLHEARDEIGQLGAAFRRMLRELREKQNLEQQMMHSERLAAVGRLAAGIAHEINNPLGGMLNALNTFKRHGQGDPLTERTVSLLERGLQQIQNTVAALLVEARVESHALTRQDIEDTHTLVVPDARRKAAQFFWENEIDSALPLPSTLVRQILLNLLLNAVQAIEPHGRIHCHIACREQRLCIRTRNDGRHIPAEQLPYLFEPFSRLDENGHGLGLWVTYQIVRQLEGEITVASTPGETRFDVQLPLRKAA